MNGELPENQLRDDIARSMDINTTQQVSTEGGLPGVDSTKDAASWLRELKAADSNLKRWHDKGIEITKRFLDIRTNDSENVSKYNLFTTNTQILISTLYAKFPKPAVTREYEDPDDDVGRVAALILERNLAVKDRDDFDIAMKHVVQDRLVPGLGQIWFRYEPTIVSEPNPDYQPPQMPLEGAEGQPELSGMPEQPQQPQMLDRLVNEEVATDYVHWQDFIWSPCRIWEECRWVGRKVKMTKADVEKRFGKAIAEALKYKKGNVGDSNDTNVSSEDNENQEVNYATVVEIWCKRSRKIYWISEGFPNCLDVKDDPFKLVKFWPCPKPIMALTATSSTIPRPDYLMAQDQYRELDDINNRITYLERAVKVVGIYDKTNKEIGRIFTEGVDNQMLAADNFSQFAEGGGFKGLVDWLPLADIVGAIEKLRQYRMDLIQQIYEITGISDIMRGASKASETLGAQELKAQYGSVRLQFLQMEVASFVEEALDIKATIMINRFQPETMVARSNIEMIPADAEQIQPAMALLKSPLMKFRVMVHADSMAVPEFNAERDARLQYLRTVAEFLTGMAPIIQTNPGAAPFLLQMLQWGAAGFRVGRTIEGVLDKAVQAANKALAAPPPAPAPPTPQETAVIKKDESQALLNTAKAVGQGIENKTLKEKPELAFPPPKPAAPTAH